MALPAGADLQLGRQRRAAAREASAALDPLLPLRVGGDGHPVFCAPPVTGLSWCYLALRPHLGAEHPIYGLQSRGLLGPESLPATMREMARDFASQIRTVRPTGPYHLLGWSLGGNVAFAVAEELERSGEHVGLLTILDASPHVQDGLTADDDRAWLLYNFALAEFGYQPALVAGEPEPEARALALVRGRSGLLDEWSDRQVFAFLRVVRNNVAVARGHQPGRVRCPLLFVSATANPPATEQKLAHWRSFVEGSVDVLEVDCRHEHMLLPAPISRVGAALTTRLARGAPAT